MPRARFFAPCSRGATFRERRDPPDRRRAARPRHPRGARTDRRRADRCRYDHRAARGTHRSCDVPHRPGGRTRREGAPDAACEKGGTVHADHPGSRARRSACAAAGRRPRHDRSLDRRRRRGDPAPRSRPSRARRGPARQHPRAGWGPPYAGARRPTSSRARAAVSRTWLHVAPSRATRCATRSMSCSGSRRRPPTSASPTTTSARRTSSSCRAGGSSSSTTRGFGRASSTTTSRARGTAGRCPTRTGAPSSRATGRRGRTRSPTITSDSGEWRPS